jgi:hypothetical protein
MKATRRDRITNQKGSALVAALLMVGILTIIAIAATRTSETEFLISANERAYVNEFYRVEGALIDTLERPSTWLTGNMLTDDETVASNTVLVDVDSDGTDDARIEIRCIQDKDLDVATANDLPALPHKSPPPPGSGYGMKYFEMRRYAITATSTTGNTRIQTGVWKAFNISQ